MRIRARVIYDVDGWAYHNRALALRKYAPADFDVAIAPYPRRADIDAALGDEPADVVLLLPAVRAETVRTAMRSRGWQAKLVSAWSYPWPADLAALQRAQEHSDWVVFTNRLSWARAGKPANSSTIWNGVDREVFRVTIPFERRRQKVLWVGARLSRAEGIRLVHRAAVVRAPRPRHRVRSPACRLARKQAPLAERDVRLV